MSKKGEYVHVIFKKGGVKPDSTIVRRFDGTEVFIEYKPNLVFHDLAHFAIESTLSIRSGFYWLINKGLAPSDFTSSKDQRPELLTESLKNPDHIAIEYLANQLLVEATNSGRIDDFLEVYHDSMAERSATKPSFKLDDIILNDIRELYETILAGWRMFPPGKEKKVMVYYPGDDDHV